MNQVCFSFHLPPIEEVFSTLKPPVQQGLVICDKKLKSLSLLKPWLKKDSLRFYFVTAGEKTKSLENLPLHFKEVLSLCKNLDKNSLLFISLGGGSIGDLTGFLSSIYKRSVPFVHFPTTWLSALDSAHGGKNALNFQNIKNVAGTYYFPEAVFIVKDFLKNNSIKQRKEAFAELLKIALIEGESFYKNLYSSSLKYQEISGLNKRDKKLKRTYKGSFPSTHFMEKFLKEAIFSKMKIVQKDPYEKKSLRKKLNFGHTIGHVLESLHSLPHGQAVLQGLLFSLEWSFQKRFLNKKIFTEIKSLIPKQKKNKKIHFKQFKKILHCDKKHRKRNHLEFIFIHQPGEVF